MGSTKRQFGTDKRATGLPDVSESVDNSDTCGAVGVNVAAASCTSGCPRIPGANKDLSSADAEAVGEANVLLSDIGASAASESTLAGASALARPMGANRLSCRCGSPERLRLVMGGAVGVIGEAGVLGA